jgi:hypothetical protein
MARLVEAPSVRSIGIARQALTGRLQLMHAGRAEFESSLERDWLRVLDFRDDVAAIREQPFSVRYRQEGILRRYTPDVLVEYGATGQASETVVYEVKPAEVLRAAWAEYKPRFKAARAYCRARGWRFKIITEKGIRTPFLKNARFLRPYLRIPEMPVMRWQLLYTLSGLGRTTPQALLAAAYWDEQNRMAAIPVLWKLVAARVVGTDLDRPLTMSSPIWETNDA